MSHRRSFANPPELLIYAKAFFVGLLVIEVLWLGQLGGRSIASEFAASLPQVRLLVVGVVALLFLAYLLARGAHTATWMIAKSLRVDLFAVAFMGGVATVIIEPVMEPLHRAVAKQNAAVPLFIALVLGLIVASVLIRALINRPKPAQYQLFFLSDDEIGTATDDALAVAEHAKRFAETVLTSGSSGGLVFGLDGPWGTGKTSFLNIAEEYWRASASDEVIVYRFEPLRYASDQDLAERFIRELTNVIQDQIYAPEFRPAATRYSRMLKGKAEWSLLGFKLQVEPSSETLDELLDDIDDVLGRLHRKLIVVVDDLDRLDAKGVNNVLFTTRKTFRLRNAVYILCYDHEVLATSKEEGERARQFLEKFVNVKLSLFVDTSSIISFLRHDWANDAAKYESIPSKTMLKLGSVLSEVANTLESEDAAGYASLLGDLRKVKRLVNALLLIRIEEADLDKTDFNRADLVNLVLLHLYFPGVFRDIYAEETDGRAGRFSIKRGGERGARRFENDARFPQYLSDLQPAAHFLLTKLFSVDALGLEDSSDAEEAVRMSRACFNEKPDRVLEQYLKLIVRFAAPEHRKTFKLYQDSVGRVIAGARVQEVLSGLNFNLRDGEYSHDQFWRVLVNRAHEFRGDTGEDAISTLVNCLPRYSAVDTTSRGLRHRSLYTLISLIDRAGWGRTPTGRRANTPENVVEIAHRFFGDGNYKGRALIEALADPKRGLLGIYDLLVFRLQCSADRGGQIYNVTTGLVVYSDPSGPTSGPTVQIAIAGMRLLSQRVFALFKERYIDTGINYLDEANTITDDAMLGEAAPFIREEARKTGKETELTRNLAGMRTLTLNLISFQIANKEISSGVGTGYYDLEGTADQGGISGAMNDYLFDVCFNPGIQAKNYEHFLDFCLANLTRSFWSGDDEQRGYHASAQGLTRGIDAAKLKGYWAQHAAAIKHAKFNTLPKEVVTLNYLAKYSEDLPQVYDVLDGIVRSAETPSTGAAQEASDNESAK